MEEIAKAVLAVFLGAAAKAVGAALQGASLKDSVKAGIEHAESAIAEKEIPGFHDTTGSSD